MLTSRKKNPNMSRKSESVLLRFLVSTDSRNYGHDALGDWSCKNIIKVNFPFACRSVAIERESKVCQGKYVIWHTCPADELEKKTNMDPWALFVHLWY